MPLHYAVVAGNWACARILLGRGADVNAHTAAGETPIAIAKVRGDREMMRLLREHDAKGGGWFWGR
jgi:ankyrin repeat protein